MKHRSRSTGLAGALLLLVGMCGLVGMCALVGPAGSVAGAATAGTGATVRIGLEAPLSGDLEEQGVPMLNAAQLAAAQLNARGGINGKKVEIVAIDDAGDPATGVTAANAAIAAGLDAVVGPWNSGVGAKVLPLYIAAGLVPMRMTSDDATNGGLGFTVQPMTSQFAPVTADAMSGWLGAKRVAIVFDPTTAYTAAIAQDVQKLLVGSGVEITAFEPIQPGQADYADVVGRLAATTPDVIYVATYFPEGGLIAKEIAALEGTPCPTGAKCRRQPTPQCFADAGAYSSEFIRIAGLRAARACPVVGVPAPSEFPKAKRYVAAYRKEFRTPPGVWSPYVFDSVNLLADAAREAGGFDAAGITAALARVRDWPGWTGAVTLVPGSGNREPSTVAVLRATSRRAFRVDPDWARSTGFGT